MSAGSKVQSELTLFVWKEMMIKKVRGGVWKETNQSSVVRKSHCLYTQMI